ncbi:hypothetical protein TSUD_376340 [Trifolium subterraneum]|uniref:Uncharacterized protein n=1 Tax=Trifolium subterraneum TaxID=3900 RepID=A0A2Z6NFB1_TRISU|nr:hypothetical protein TSUD_376340 [Trifolium subterraneum]
MSFQLCVAGGTPPIPLHFNFATAVSGLTRAFSGCFVEITALSTPDSTCPLVRNLENMFFTAWEVESAVFDCRVLAVAENFWPYTLCSCLPV